MAHLCLDRNGCVRWANPAATTLLGAPATAVGADFAALTGLGESQASGPDAQHAATIDRWLECHRVDLDDGDTLLCVLDAQPAVDARSRADRLDEVLGNARELGRLGVWWRDLDTMQGHWDAEVYRMWGLAPQTGAPDFSRVIQQIEPEDRQILEQTFAESIRQAGRYQIRYRIRRADGSLRRLHSQWLVRNGDHGRPAHVVGLVMDDSEAWSLALAHDARASEIAIAEKLSGLIRWQHDLRTDVLNYVGQPRDFLQIEVGPEGVHADKIRALIHPDDLPRVRASADHTRHTGEPTDFEARYRRPDGQWRDVMTRRTLQRDPSGEPIAFIGVSMDVSALAAAKRAALVLGQRLELATRSAGVGHWSLEPGAERATWSTQMREMHGLGPDAPVPSVHDWIAQHVHPDDRDGVRQGFRRLHARECTHVSAEIRIVRADGEVRTLLANSQLDPTHEPPALFGIAIDITERRQIGLALRRADERAAHAARGAGLGTWERDLQSGELHWDAQMWRLRGREPQVDPPSMEQMLAMVHPEDRANASRRISASRSSGQTAHHEYRVIWPDGQVHWLATRSGPLQDAQGRTVRRIGVNWDVTDARRAEHERHERDLAERASQAKSEFLSRMSHELRTPLNAVLGFAELQLARHPATDPTGRSHLTQVIDAGRHLLDLINDVLDLTSLEAGRLQVQRVPVDLPALVRSALSLVEALRRAHAMPAIELGPLDAEPLADPARLRQVLVNLLSNAIKYNRPGGHVRIQAEARAGQALIHISDGGRGLDTAQLSHLFEPFNRLGAESTGIQGTGIGLAIAKSLVERMGGQLHAHSHAGAGSQFTITLPANRPETDTAPRAPAAAPRPGRGMQGTVLYVEDNPVNLLLMHELLGPFSGVSLHQAVDGASGLIAARTLCPDLVLLDMQLPDMDGHEVHRRLRADPATAGLPCVAVSANALPEVMARARAAGFTDYWTKPLDLHAVLRALEVLLAPPRPGA